MPKNNETNNKNNELTLDTKATPLELVGSDQDDFLEACILDLIHTMWTPDNLSKEDKNKKVNAAIECLKQIAPKDGVEGMLAVQMTATHHAAIECLRRAMIPNQTFEGRNMSLKHADKFLRLYMEQVKTLDKRRGKSNQKMIVEHVNVEAGGQAIVGQVGQK